MSLDPSYIVENPCEEIIPAEPFPFKSNSISRGIKYSNYLIFFPFYVEYKKCKHLYTFDIETLEWSSVELNNSPEILGISDNYVVIQYIENQFVLFGCYKRLETGQTNKLFPRSQATPKSVLGFISASISKEEKKLTLEWKEMTINKPIYLEKFSANSDYGQHRLLIFGGYNENENLSNKHLKMIEDGRLLKYQTVNKEFNKMNPIPARANHGSALDVPRGRMRIFGGEDKDSNEMNDMWMIDFRNLYQNLLPRCMKLERQTISRRPKLGTPCIWFSDFMIYVGKSSSEVINPIRSYLCIEHFPDRSKDQTQTFSSKNPLPFDGVPHTIEIIKDVLILGYESSLYSIHIQDKIGVSDLNPFDSDDGSLVKKRQKASFKDHMRQYFVERPYPDIAFRVQGEEITAHRGILSVRSKYFNELFTNVNTEDLKNPIEVEDITPAAFTSLLEWLYCSSVKQMKGEVAIELFKVADKYGAPKLKEESERILVNSLTLENVSEYAKFAVDHSAKDLESAVVSLAAKETLILKEKDQFNLLPSLIIEKSLDL